MTEPVHPFGLAVFGDFIYWTDWVRRAVLRADKYNAADVTVLRANIPQQPMGIVIMAEEANDCKYLIQMISGIMKIHSARKLSSHLTLFNITQEEFHQICSLTK